MLRIGGRSATCGARVSIPQAISGALALKNSEALRPVLLLEPRVTPLPRGWKSEPNIRLDAIMPPLPRLPPAVKSVVEGAVFPSNLALRKRAIFDLCRVVFRNELHRSELLVLPLANGPARSRLVA